MYNKVVVFVCIGSCFYNFELPPILDQRSDIRGTEQS